MKKALTITIFSILSVITVGVATFVYVGQSSESSDVNVKIAEYKTIGDISLTGYYKVIIDATNIYSDCTLSATISNTSEDYTITSKTYSFTYSDNFKEYFNITGTLEGDWSDGKIITAPTITYIDDKKPTTNEELSALKAVIDSSIITVTFMAS